MASEFEITRGTTETLTCELVSQAGTPIDLTGYSSASLYADKSLNATAPVLEKSATSVSPTSGEVSFSFAVGDTASLATGEYLAEVHVTIGAVQYRTIQPFIFRIMQRVKA